MPGKPSKKNARRNAPARSKTRRKSKKKSSWWAWPVSIVMIAVLAVIGQKAMEMRSSYAIFNELRSAVDNSSFYTGVVIEGVDVSGRSLYEVLNSRKEYEDAAKANVSVNIAYGDQVWAVVADDLDYQTDYEEVIRRGYRLGREGTVLERYNTIKSLESEGLELTITQSWDETILRGITDEIAASLTQAGSSAGVASFDMSTKTFAFTDEQIGYEVDADGLYQAALAAAKSGSSGDTVYVDRKTVYPKYARSDLEGKFGLVADFDTSCYGSSSNRVSNIKLALSVLNGVCVMPGETFSFNTTLGQRTESKGYKVAGAFVDGMAGEEVGGGICQVSTTLFNAVARANLAIAMRNPHSRTINYVDVGADAAVSWPNQDFQFTNDTDFPVFILTEMFNHDYDLRISVYGKRLENGVTIDVIATTTEVIDPGEDEITYVTDLKPGVEKVIEKARKGYRAEAYRVYYDANGGEIRRELLCKSYYKPAGAIIHIGSGI